MRRSIPTWWGQRWSDATARLGTEKRRERGVRYAKSGQVLSLRVEQGIAVAEVQGTRSRPYKVEIGLPMFTRKQWTRVADALLKKTFYAAKLLAGEMPPEIEPLFRSAGAALLPTSKNDFSADCSCPDLENPCKHVAAVTYVLGQEFDRDPFLLMEMRGCGRAQLLAEMQLRRSGDKPTEKALSKTPELERPARTVLSARLNDFFQTPKGRSLSWPGEGAARESRLKPGDRLHEMGSPPFWQSDNDFEEVLTKIYQAVRKRTLG